MWSSVGHPRLYLERGGGHHTVLKWLLRLSKEDPGRVVIDGSGWPRYGEMDAVAALSTAGAPECWKATEPAPRYTRLRNRPAIGE